MNLRFLALAGLLVSALLIGLTSWGAEPTYADQPFGVLSIDTSLGDNQTDSVGTIDNTLDATVESANLNDGVADLAVDLVIGDAGTQDGVDESGGIPAGEDIGGWQARLQYDPAVLKFAGLQAVNCSGGGFGEPAPEAVFFMEKADICSSTTNNHIVVVDDLQIDQGIVTIGSTITGTPAGANGVGRLAFVFFEAIADGATCIDLVPVDDEGIPASFYTDVDQTDHDYAELNSAAIGVNGGTPPISCPEQAAPTATATATATPTSTATTEPTATSTATATATLQPTATATPTPQVAAATATPAGGPSVLPPTGGSGSTGGWTTGWSIALMAAGLGLTVAGGAAYWRYYRRRS